jgi:hypothetical protein
LHSGAGNKNAFKALIAAEYSGIKVELTKDFEMGVSNKTPEFLKMNPLGKVYQAPIIIFEYLCIVVPELKLLFRFLFWRLLMALFLRVMLSHAMVYIEPHTFSV